MTRLDGDRRAIQIQICLIRFRAGITMPINIFQYKLSSNLARIERHAVEHGLAAVGARCDPEGALRRSPALLAISVH
jgi:hypothetical protein